MTLGQVRALCAGLDALERSDEARQIGMTRLAMWGEADEIDKHLDQLRPAGPDPTDAILAQFSGGDR
jgi:hypothetical protein